MRHVRYLDTEQTSAESNCADAHMPVAPVARHMMVNTRKSTLVTEAERTTFEVLPKILRTGTCDSATPLYAHKHGQVKEQ